MADRLSLASALDGLTGLAGSRHFEDVLKREWTRAARGGTPLAIILCDIDAYAAFCERYGHGRGDELLRLVAHVLLLHARRANDLVARTDEQRFALLMPLAETTQAAKVADQIREAVQALDVENSASPVADQVTVSLGVASFMPQKGMSFKILEQTAVNMLEAAAKDGHNRVCAYHPNLA
jgi:diguanylate cyclase (GGDEF)-like protein